MPIPILIEQMKEILSTAKVIASVGLSSNPEKDSYEVGQYLQEQGYRIIPVNPTADEILGEKSYPSLSAVPEKIDVVQVFRKPADVPAARRSLFGRPQCTCLPVLFPPPSSREEPDNASTTTPQQQTREGRSTLRNRPQHYIKMLLLLAALE